MFEIDVFTRTTGNRPFKIETYHADNAFDATRIVRQQTKILQSKFKYPVCMTTGSLMQFKTNRGNLYAEIEVNEIQDKQS